MTYFQTHLTVASNGRVVIPANMRAELGVPDGGKLVARLVDGTVVLEPLDMALKRLQAFVAQHIPPGVSLADELIAERRAEADRE